MRRLRRPVAALAALAVSTALLVGACGGDDSQEAFERDVVAARDRTDSALARVTQPKSLDDLILRMRSARDEIATASGELGAAEAPEALDEEKRALTGALSALANDVGATADAFEELGPGAAEVRTLEWESWNRVQRALEALRSEGVEVEPLGRHAGDEAPAETGES